MKIEVLLSFREKIGYQSAYIAKDKSDATGKFKKEIIKKIKQPPKILI